MTTTSPPARLRNRRCPAATFVPAPAPATPTTLTARLRELMEEANTAELANKLADASARWRTKEFDDLCHANTDVIIEALRNAPTIIRLLEAVDEVSDDMLAAFNASVEASLPYVRMRYDNDTLRRAIAATLRAAREGAR